MGQIGSQIRKTKSRGKAADGVQLSTRCNVTTYSSLIQQCPNRHLCRNWSLTSIAFLLCQWVCPAGRTVILMMSDYGSFFTSVHASLQDSLGPKCNSVFFLSVERMSGRFQ